MRDITIYMLSSDNFCQMLQGFEDDLVISQTDGIASSLALWPHLWVPLASADHFISVVTQGGTRFATANLAYPGLNCITPSAFVLPTEQYRENKANLILPCLLRHLDWGKKTIRLKRPCLSAITALNSRKVQPLGESGRQAR